jgi:hypothetical protein
MQSASRDRAIDQPDETLELGVDRCRVARLDGRGKPLCQRLDRRLVAQILEPLFSGGPDPLLLLFDVRHVVKTPATAGSGILAKPVPAWLRPTEPARIVRAGWTP